MNSLFEKILEALPLIMTLLLVAIPTLILFFKRFANLKKEIGEALAITADLIDELADVATITAKGLEDGKLTKEEISAINAEIMDVRIKIGPLLSEWKDVYRAALDLVKPQK